MPKALGRRAAWPPPGKSSSRRRKKTTAVEPPTKTKYGAGLMTLDTSTTWKKELTPLQSGTQPISYKARNVKSTSQTASATQASTMQYDQNHTVDSVHKLFETCVWLVNPVEPTAVPGFVHRSCFIPCLRLVLRPQQFEGTRVRRR